MAKPDVLKVSSTTIPAKLAGSISECVRSSGVVELRSIGAGSVNQSIKAIAISRGHLAPMGIEITCQPAFLNASIDGESKTVIIIKVFIL